MDNVLLEVVFIAALILINGLFSMTEIAVLSARRVRLTRTATDGNAGAATAIKLQQHPETFLSTVQVGITLIGILSGAFGGALLAGKFSDLVARSVLLAPYANMIGFGIVIVTITYFTLIFGELVPKNLALNKPELIASTFSRPMNLISRLTAPVVWLLSRSTALVLKVFRIRESTDAAITEEEIKAHIAHGTEIGILDETEQELIESIIKLDDQRVTAFMTSRLKILWLDLEEDVEINRQKLIDSPFSRLPVCRESLDNIVGIVKSRDLLSHLLKSGDLDLETVLKQPVYVPESITGLELLEVFKKSHSLMALVIDEFGAVEGLVTMNDVLEEIVGHLPVGGVTHQSIVQREDGSWLIDGYISIVDLKDLLGENFFPDTERKQYQTLAGFILARLEKVPTVGEAFKWRGYVFEVVDMDGRRIDKVMVTKDPGI